MKFLIAILFCSGSIFSCIAMDNDPLPLSERSFKTQIYLGRKIPPVLSGFILDNPTHRGSLALADLVEQFKIEEGHEIGFNWHQEFSAKASEALGYISRTNLPDETLPLSPYTINRLYQEMLWSLAHNKKVPYLPFNERLENQNSFYFIRLLPEGLKQKNSKKIDLGPGDCSNGYSTELRALACCLYALCEGADLTKGTEQVKSTKQCAFPVLKALPPTREPWTLKHLMRDVLNFFAYKCARRGIPQTPEEMDAYCETIISQFQNNKAIIDATKDINEQFNLLWEQTYQKINLESVRPLLLAAHDELHKVIITPDFKRNNLLMTSDAIKKFFADALAKHPYIRCTDGILSEYQPLFDELPPIVDYDPKSSAVLPEPWKGKKKCAKNDDVLKHLPSIIQDYYAPAGPGVDIIDRFKQFLNGDTITKSVIMKPIINMQHDLSLSPQTAYALEQTILQLIHGVPVQMKDSRLSYNKSVEFGNKMRLMSQLSPILKDLLQHSKEEFRVCAILTPLFKPASNKDTLESGRYWLGDLILNHNRNGQSWCFKTISPQTVVKIAQGYTDLVHNGTPMSDRAYDLHNEESNLAVLIRQFPHALNAPIGDAHKPDMWGLAYIAYWLKNPEWKKVLIDVQFDMGSFLRDAYKRYNYGMNAESGAVSALKHQFIRAFGPLTYCQDELKKNILFVCMSQTMCEKLKNIIDQNAERIRAGDNADSKDFDALTEELREDLPSCSICMELFSNHFFPAKGGRRMAIQPCTHAFCNTCLSKLTTCPLCRGAIVSTIEASEC